MEENQQIQRAIALQKQGQSIRQIAIELGISKSKVFRWFSAEPNNTENKSQIIQIPLKTTIENYTKTKINRTHGKQQRKPKIRQRNRIKKTSIGS
jgi:orotate phosphoribosyltransferase-like protein